MRLFAFSSRTAKEILRDPLNIFFGLGFPLVLIGLLTAIQANIPVSLFELDHLTPGITVFGLSFMTLFSATLISKDRESALLQRLYTTPLTASDFIFGYDAPIFVNSNSNVVIDEVIINAGSTLEEHANLSPDGILVNQGSGSVVTMNSGAINVNGKSGNGVYMAYATPDKTNVGNHTFNFNGGTINVNTTKDGYGIQCLSSNTLNLNGGTINMKDSTEGYAFNVAQASSTRAATVVTGNGTVINLFGGTNILCTDSDKPQLEKLGLTIVEK